MIEQYAQGSYGMTPTKDGDFVKYQDYKQALAEKDREIEYLQECRISAAAMDAQRIIEYQQLMEKAVRFAECAYELTDGRAEVFRMAKAFLTSPEAQAWKEQQ